MSYLVSAMKKVIEKMAFLRLIDEKKKMSKECLPFLFYEKHSNN